MAERTCSIEGCKYKQGRLSRGWCPAHYRRWRLYGDPEATRMRPFEARFWSRVEKTETCWLWRGTIMPNGYGTFTSERGGSALAHRIAYELAKGPVPDGLPLDHLCRVRHCVNPAHLEPVTNQENLRRGDGWTGQRARQTHCKHGHPFDEANTRIRPNGTRQCRACAREQARRAYHRK